MSIGGIADKTLVVGAPVGAITAPWWIEYLNTGSTAIVLVCAAVVGIARAWIAIRDLRNKR